MKCNVCGKEVAEGLRFCDVCGAELEAPKAEPTPVAEPAPVVEPVTTPVDNKPEQPKKNPGNGLGLASLIVGIASIVVTSILWCVCGTMMLFFVPPIVQIICGIVGLILAVIGMKKSKAAGMKNVMAIIGLILGILSVVSAVLATIAMILILVLGLGAGILSEMGSGALDDMLYY